MAVTSEQIIDFLLANPGMTDAQIVSAMEQNGVSPAQMAQAVGLPVTDVESRYNAALPFVNPVIEERVIDMGDGTRSEYYIKGTNIQADAPTFSEVMPTTGLTESSAPELKANNITIYDPQAKGEYVYTPEGQLIGFNPGERDSGFGGFLNEVYQDNKNVINSALTFGALDAAGLLGGAGTVGSTGLTTAELAQLDLALGGAGGTTGATQLANALMTGAAVPTITSLTGGSGTGALTGALGSTVAGMGGGTGLTAGAGGLGLSTTGAGLGAAGTGAGLVTGAGTGLGTGLGTTLAGVGTGVGTGIGSTLAGVGTGVGTALGTGLTNAATGGLTAAQIGALLSGGLTTGSGLLQQQTSREAAIRAQQMIDAETAAAKQAAQFRPVGMTTRFGTSQFTVDPVTGQLTSAGYTLSPEAKNAQDRLVALAEQGLQQAEGAQQQFAPLQTGAQNLFNLGNQYIAQSPQEVAQNYLNQQMALLQPGRELELANLQNKLQQQGRGGLAVAQGGALGATTPELQALYNARAQQEAQLAANAQQFGQQNVTFGAGLLGQGASAMGQYYGGQQAAYAPYTTALGQVQALETAAQQPLTMGAALGQQAATAGANMGRLGLTGAGQSVALATGEDATRNPYASLLSGVAANPAFNQFVGGLFSSVPAMTAMSTPATSFGTGGYYGNQDLGLFL